jgi:hypothetical protein
MIGRTIRLVVLGLILAIAAPALSLAHEGHPHKVMGTVTMAGADHVMVKTKDGKELTASITPETKILKDKAPAKVEDLTDGTRVVLTVVTTKGKSTAKEIQIGVKAPLPTKNE